MQRLTEKQDSINVTHSSNCAHCHESLAGAQIFLEHKAFCCQGCRVVYSCLYSGGLDFYYELSEKEGRSLNKAEFSQKYIYLKDSDFLSEYQVSENTYLFYVNGIECLACTWLFENLEALDNTIVVANYSHDNKTVSIEVTDRDNLYQAILPIVNLGYELKPLKTIKEAVRLNVSKKRSDLIRLAVAMVVMGNINLFSLSYYFGLDSEKFTGLFTILSAVIFLAIPLYAALPFYRTSIDFLKKKKVSLDLPISFSIIMGSILSYIAAANGSADYYFDSIATFVFLILFVRFFLDELYQKKGQYDLLEEVYGESQAYIKKNGSYIAKHIAQVSIGDVLRLMPNEVSPAEGKVISGESFFNEALVTGESRPVYKNNGDTVFAGALNYSSEIELEITKDIRNTTLASYLNEFKNKKQRLGGYSSFAKKYAAVLLLMFTIATVFLFSMFPVAEASTRVLALVIICCPCALGIGIPLVTLLANRSLLRKGIIIKKPDFLSELQQVKKIYFDKTGTLTTGKFNIKKITGNLDYLPKLVSLEKYSSHPIARSICSHYSSVKTDEVEKFREVIGAGPEGYIEGTLYQVRKGYKRNEIVLLMANEKLLSLELEEQYRQGLNELLTSLGSEYELAIISGDSKESVDNFKEQANLEGIEAYSELLPLEKKQIVSSENCLYVGDGLNDIPALSKTGLSISLNAIPLVDEASDCIFLKSDLTKLTRLFSTFNGAKKIIVTNIFISIIYNILGASFAVSGLCSPLLAAVFMPVSSLFVVGHTFYRTRNF